MPLMYRREGHKALHGFGRCCTQYVQKPGAGYSQSPSFFREVHSTFSIVSIS